MTRSTHIRTIGIAILLACRIGFAEQTTEPESSLPIQKSNLYIVYDPPQLEMYGPYPFMENPQFSYGDPTSSTRMLPEMLRGTGIDQILALDQNRKMGEDVQRSWKVPGSSHDYLHTVATNLGLLSTGTDLIITGIDPLRFNIGSRLDASWILKNSDADHVLFFRSTYFMSPELDQLRMRASVDLFSRKSNKPRTRNLYSRTYEYLSPSRGILFRPFAEGEKDVLTSMIEAHFDNKTEEFPHNSRAYKKDRDRILRAIRNRDTILPNVAVGEGWSEESMAFEIQTATNHIIFMVQQDLQSRESDIALNRPIGKFAIMLDNGNSRTIKGNSIGNFENNTIYRDRSGNVFSLPVSAPDVE